MSQRGADWEKIIAFAIDLVLLYVLCVAFIGPVVAGIGVINEVDPLMSSGTARAELAAQAIRIQAEGSRNGWMLFVVFSTIYFIALAKLKRRSIGQIIVGNFTVQKA